MLGFIGVTDVRFVTAGAVAREIFLKPALERVRIAAV
jgi:hypothetical protein